MSAGRATVAAVDLGASGGRVMAGDVGQGRLELHEVHRFANRPVSTGSTLHWDVLGLYSQVLDGLRAAGAAYDVAGVGIDAWGVDYGLLDADGALLGNPVHYRDARTNGVPERVTAMIGAAELYQATGIALLPITTLCQLVAAAGTAQLAAARTLLLMPDLLGYWLTGEIGAELTNALTTQLCRAGAGTEHEGTAADDAAGGAGGWAAQVIERTGLPAWLFPPLRRPGTVIGPLRADALAQTGLAPAVPVIAVASHDTASAVVATPAAGPGFAYISCGTWSLVGTELDQPVLTEESRLAGFTNEAGIDGTVRYLRNVMGLWLLQESVRTWELAGHDADLAALLGAAATAEPLRSVVDPDDLEFLPPGDMPARIAGYCLRTGQPVPGEPAQVVRCILDSLALAHSRAVEQVQELAGHRVNTVHIVGGGSRNELLCQLTADACGLPVLAGPAEATALGNVLVQGRALGAAPAELAGLRALVRETQQVRPYMPAGQAGAWKVAGRRADKRLKHRFLVSSRR